MLLGVAGTGILLFPAPGHAERRGAYEPAEDATSKGLEGGEENELEGGGSAGVGVADEPAVRPRPRLKGGGGDGGSGGSWQRLQEVECRPILPAGSGGGRSG